jgi:hypothetical protein
MAGRYTEGVSRTNDALPEFAAAWMSQWKSAAEPLRQIRDQELRVLGHDDVTRATDVLAAAWARDRERYSGLVEQQAWFMRQRCLEALRR